MQKANFNKINFLIINYNKLWQNIQSNKLYKKINRYLENKILSTRPRIIVEIKNKIVQKKDQLLQNQNIRQNKLNKRTDR